MSVSAQVNEQEERAVSFITDACLHVPAVSEILGFTSVSQKLNYFGRAQ